MKFSNFSSLTVQKSFPGTPNSNPNFEIQSAVVTKCSPLTVFQMKFSNLICSLTINLKPFRSPFPELQTAISIFEIHSGVATKCSPLTVFQKEISNFILQFNIFHRSGVSTEKVTKTFTSDLKDKIFTSTWNARKCVSYKQNVINNSIFSFIS